MGLRTDCNSARGLSLTPSHGPDSEGLPAFVQDLQAGVADEDAVASLAGVFADDTRNSSTSRISAGVPESNPAWIS